MRIGATLEVSAMSKGISDDVDEDDNDDVDDDDGNNDDVDEAKEKEESGVE